MMNRTASNILFFVSLLGLLLGLVPVTQASWSGHRLPQEATEEPYPGLTDEPTSDSGYAPPTSAFSPTVEENTPSPGESAQTPFPTSSPAFQTLTSTPNLARNWLLTEDAEMRNARVTPPADALILPGITMSPSPTITPTPAAPTGFTLNQRWFTAGLLIPLILFGLGWLGYRWAHSPEFSEK